MPGWESIDFVLLALMPILLVASAFFSGSETAVFSLRPADCSILRDRTCRSATASLSLVQQQRTLLITLLLGNMLTNILYFIISSVLLLHLDMSIVNPIVPLAMSICVLLVLILTAEVAPKLIASRDPIHWLALCAITLLVIHQVISPLRFFLSSIVVQPLLRLMSFGSQSSQMQLDEINALLLIATEQGHIDVGEQQLLSSIVKMSSQRVSSIMCPRNQAFVCKKDQTRSEVMNLISIHTHTPHLPVYGDDLDDICGLLDANKYLLDANGAVESYLMEPVFIPDTACLDHAASHFRDYDIKMLVVVDEYGQTAGFISLADLLDEIFHLESAGEDPSDWEVQIISMGVWHVSGGTPIEEFADGFHFDMTPSRAVTVAGYMIDQLGTIGKIGDFIQIGSYTITILEMDHGRITLLEVQESTT